MISAGLGIPLGGCLEILFLNGILFMPSTLFYIIPVPLSTYHRSFLFGNRPLFWPGIYFTREFLWGGEGRGDSTLITWRFISLLKCDNGYIHTDNLSRGKTALVR